MWIAILIVLLALAMAIGPIMWLRTTPSQRRVIAARQRAARIGLRVQLMSLADLGLPGQESSREAVAGYCLPRLGAEDEQKPSGHPWRLLKQRMSHEGHFAGWWDWQRGREAREPWHEPLRQLLPELPPDSLVIEKCPQGLCLYWRERGGAEQVERVAAVLRRLREIEEALPEQKL